MQIAETHITSNQNMLNIAEHGNMPLHFDEVGHRPASNFIMHVLLSNLANKFVVGNTENIKFSIVETEKQWQLVRSARLKIYNEGSPHLKQLVNEEGVDAYDLNSFVFFASYKGQVLGTVRLNRFPFETSKFIESTKLNNFLGSDCDNFLEVSRLAIDSDYRITGISNALIIYACLITACSTQYKHYLAYSHPKLKDRVFRFQQHLETMPFAIPGRRAIDYVLFKGTFWEDFSALIASHGEGLFDSLQQELLISGANS